MSKDNARFTFLHRIEEVELNIEDALACYRSSDKAAGSAMAGGQKNTRDSSIQSTGIKNNN